MVRDTSNGVKRDILVRAFGCAAALKKANGTPAFCPAGDTDTKKNGGAGCIPAPPSHNLNVYYRSSIIVP